MLRPALLGPLLAASVFTGSHARGATELFRLHDPRIDESSGIVVSSYSDRVFFTHNDSGDRRGRVFAIDGAGRTLAEVRPQVRTRDLEDIGRLGQVLWLADIGDNRRVRDEVHIIRVREPRVTSAVGRIRATGVLYRFRYADGPHDAESLLVQPGTGRLYVATKTLLGRSAVYAAPPRLDGGGINRLTKVADVPLLPTGGAFSPSGDRLVLRGYRDALLWRVDGSDVAAAWRRPPQQIALPLQRQGEGVTFTRDGRRLVISSEGVNAPVYVVPLPSLAAAAPGEGWGAPGAEAPARRWLFGGVAIALVAGAVAVTRRARAKR